MTPKPAIFFLLAAALAPLAPADTISAVSSGSYTNASVWSSNAAPTAGNNYVIGSGFTVSSTWGAVNGDGIEIDSGGTYTLGINSPSTSFTSTLPALVLNGGTLVNQKAGNSSGTNNVTAGTLTVNADSAIVLQQSTNNFSSNLTLNTALSGSGNLAVSSLTTATNTVAKIHNLTIASANNNYTGDWTLSNPGGLTRTAPRLVAGAANALGTGSVTLEDNAMLQVTVAGGLNSISGVVLNAEITGGLYNLVLTQTWTNTDAFLAITNSGAGVDLGSGASSIGTLTIGGTALGAGTYSAADLTTLGYGGVFTGTGTITVAAVPEPAVCGLCGAGVLAGLAFLRRRRQSSAR